MVDFTYWPNKHLDISNQANSVIAETTLADDAFMAELDWLNLTTSAILDATVSPTAVFSQDFGYPSEAFATDTMFDSDAFNDGEMAVA